VSFITQLFGKKSDYPSEYKRFKKAIERNPGDHGLKTQFIKFCLLNRFTKQETDANNSLEALKLFETIDPMAAFDLQCHYLVGKYYQEDKNYRKAYQVYLEAIKRFNQFVGKNPHFKTENEELAYSISLNLMTLQANPVDPELETCFSILRKSYPLHLKRVELENEMAKPAPDQARIKQLTTEIRQLRAEEESKEQEEEKIQAAPEEKAPEPSAITPPEKEDMLTKLFRVPTPDPQKLTEWVNMDIQKQQKMSEPGKKADPLKFSPLAGTSEHSSVFMVFRNNDWEGPLTIAQLRSSGPLSSDTWVCRVGSQLVTQAYEVPDLHSLIR
jgi:hypothetical protein